MKKRKIENIAWFRYAQRFSSDFPLLFVNCFFEGQKKYLGLKKLLYIGKGAYAYAYRDKAEFEAFYCRIRHLKKNDFLKIAQETSEATYKFLNILKKNSLLKEFKEFIECFYKFAAFFIYVQYIGQVYKDDPKILKYFDEKVIRKIRFAPIIPAIKKKLKKHFDEISHKFSVKPDTFFWLFPQEIEAVLKKQGLNKQLLQRAKLRKKLYVFILLDGKRFLYISQDAKKIAEKILSFEKSIQAASLKGVVAHRGLAQGKVKVVLSRKDFKKIKKGDVLVAVFTMPYYLPIFKKASAIITDEGGLLSHASVMARELKKPCIKGTKIATKVLKDGDLVKVDANRGIIKIVKKSSF